MMHDTISFYRTFAADLRSGAKQQTTRKYTERFCVGDVVHITIVPRKRYGGVPAFSAYSIGKVKLVDVADVRMYENSVRSDWAKADGFDNFEAANIWFTKQYGEDWHQRTWTVIRWDGWL